VRGFEIQDGLLKWNQLILDSVSAMFIKIWLAAPVHSKSCLIPKIDVALIFLEVDLCYFITSSDYPVSM
jgi:hypothetical protein